MVCERSFSVGKKTHRVPNTNLEVQLVYVSHCRHCIEVPCGKSIWVAKNCTQVCYPKAMDEIVEKQKSVAGQTEEPLFFSV